MPGKPPYFPFYVNDFAGDSVVSLMTTEQVGAYTLLLCKAWQQDQVGTLPAENAALARWAGLSLERWLEIKDGVLAAFRLSDDGRYHQKRMKHEFARLMGTLTKKSKGGKRGAKSRWQCYGNEGGKVNDNAMTTIRVYGSGSKSGSDSGFSPPEEGVGETGFAAFWSAYPRKVARLKAVEAWLKINPDRDLQAVILAAVDRQKRSRQWTKNAGEYIPHPTSWLNQKRWEDELPVAGPAGQFNGVDEFVDEMRRAGHGNTGTVRGEHEIPGGGGGSVG